MITHFIRHPSNPDRGHYHHGRWIPPAGSFPVATTPTTPPFQPTTAMRDIGSSRNNISHTPPPMSKLEFAQYQTKKGLKVGDFVVRKEFKPPLTTHDIMRIIYIEEIMTLVGGHEWSGGLPQCYHVQSFTGKKNSTYWKSALDFIRPEPLKYEELTPEWQAVVDEEREADARAAGLAAC